MLHQQLDSLVIHFIAQPVQAVVMVQLTATALVAEPVTQELETRAAGKVATRVERLARSLWVSKGERDFLRSRQDWQYSEK
ncbi:MAG: hypothetical protein ACM335_11180 [Deltaproteobacteria bacterium]